MRKVLLFAVVLLMFGCDEGGGSSKAQGTEGGACYPNGTCNEGLDCVNDVCSSGNTNNTNNTNNANNTNNVNNANPGELGGACLEGDLCNEGLVCSETICKTDADGDGYPSDNDCDDNDENAYPGAILECQSDCAYGTKSCNSAGEWTECTADTECSCSQAGETKDVPCGKCGTASVMCTADLVWEFPTNCQNEGECHPWEAGQQDCGFCGHQERACDSTCHWEDWSECSDQGECEAGVTEWTTDDCTPLGSIQQRECTNSCEWNILQTCTDQCIGQARVGTVDTNGIPDYKDEICVPGGAFIMGSTPEYSNCDCEFPQHIVYLSPYFIDKYEVTTGRYKECMDAGVCDTISLSPLEDRKPVENITWEQANVFCSWDGGRVLPTEAQWEKAARGPSPRTVKHPWGDTPGTCTEVEDYSCDDISDFNGPFQVGLRPAGASYYGIENMADNVDEWCSDNASYDYYSNSPNLDPQGTVADQEGYHRIRGYNCFYTINDYLTLSSVTKRSSYNDAADGLGFRCSRPMIIY